MMIQAGDLSSLADVFRIRAEKTGNSVAQIYKGKKTTYSQLNEQASKVAQGLIKAGCAPAARVGHMGKNTDTYFELLGGTAKSKTVLVGVNWRLAAPEVAYVLNDAKVEVLFVGSDFMELVESILPEVPSVREVIAMDGGHPSWVSFETWRDRHPAQDPHLEVTDGDDAIQLYTSGTTGHPKGVCLTHGNYKDAFHQAQAWKIWQAEAVNLVCMPLFHVAGVNVGTLGFFFGSCNVVLRDIDPEEILNLIEKYKIHIAFMVPAVILFLLMHPKSATTDYSHLKWIIYGASPIAEDVLLQARERFKCDFMQVYGLTETTGSGTVLDAQDHDPARGKLRSCGKPARGVSIRVVDEQGKDVKDGEVGELWIKSNAVMREYWNREDATREAIQQEWFHTGDAGFRDEEGYIFLHDRIKDMIVSGGENIYPAEVENALFSHPSIVDASVIGVPDEKWGEAVKAFVVVKEGEQLTDKDVIDFARTRIAGYKLPKSVNFVKDLPRNPSGKVLRRLLREPYWKGKSRNIS